MRTTTTTTYTRTQTFRLTGEDILELLVEAGHIDGVGIAAVKFDVPSGRNHSGMSLDIDDACPVLVRVETEEAS